MTNNQEPTTIMVSPITHAEIARALRTKPSWKTDTVDPLRLDGVLVIADPWCPDDYVHALGWRDRLDTIESLVARMSRMVGRELHGNAHLRPY